MQILKLLLLILANYSLNYDAGFNNVERNRQANFMNIFDMGLIRCDTSLIIHNKVSESLLLESSDKFQFNFKRVKTIIPNNILIQTKVELVLKRPQLKV